MRPTRVIAALLLLAPAAGAQTLDLGSMGGPDLGERSAFVSRVSYYQREADTQFALGASWSADADRATLESDSALAARAKGHLRWLCARALSGEGARNAAADHRMVVGRLLSDAMGSFDARVDVFVEAAHRVHAGGADAIDTELYRSRREALSAFVVRMESAFGTPPDPTPMGFTIRSFDNALRPVLGELTGLLNPTECRRLAEAWARTDAAPSSSHYDPALARARRSIAHHAETDRVHTLVHEASVALGLIRTVDAELFAEAQRHVESAIRVLHHAEEDTQPERVLSRVIGAGRVLGAIAPLRSGADRASTQTLDALAEDAVRAALSADTFGARPDDPLINAMDVCVRALAIAHNRRTLSEPARMNGDTRRAWLLMHAEQGDREAALFEGLRDLIARPSRVTSPALVSSIARTRAGYERLLAIRMSDDWLDELREDGRLTRLLGPTISQRSRDLLIFTLRDRIRDAADRDVRDRAIDDLNTLRARAELLGRTDLEDALARDEPAWLGETLGERLAQALADARSAWVQAWVDDDADERTRWAERLGILTRARDIVALAQHLDDPSVVRRGASVPTCVLPDDAWLPLRDRVRGLASVSVRTALRDDPSTDQDDPDVRADLTAAEDRTAGALALLALGRLAKEGESGFEDPLVRLLAACAVLPPADHPARVYRHDVASYVRWLHELHHARNTGDREAILAHLDEVGADVSARLSRD
ncbi:MAG: hypothetical protein Tsb0013_18040 [Phycisphaerales bacterium]